LLPFAARGAHFDLSTASVSDMRAAISAGAQHALQTGCQHRFGFSTPSGSLENQVAALQQWRDDLDLERTESRESAVEGTVGIGELV